ncbi:MAG: hypothetical protein AB7S70_04610 [Hyphomicrobium sp.]|uniref:hypothetical protein n=1 Tax=Hyphomicrobium sp. TaxID=82 RepID=UPI003D0A099D
MLSTLELFINGFVAFAVLPLALVSLATGSKPPEVSAFAKYYRAEKHLMLASNLFLLTVGATAVGKLVEHFGLADAAHAETLRTWINIPFLAMLVIFLVMLVRAWLTVRRMDHQSNGSPKAM